MPFSQVPASCRDTVPQNSLGSLLVPVKACPGSPQLSSAKGLDTPSSPASLVISPFTPEATPEADFLRLPPRQVPTSKFTTEPEAHTPEMSPSREMLEPIQGLRELQRHRGLEPCLGSDRRR
uniref:Uncharacterized protein n=1 Tax=Mus musculus TaxID=10090 RepID=Q3V215_MOUSE|nr:unnamed protein product [Mus musculus]